MKFSFQPFLIQGLCSPSWILRLFMISTLVSSCAKNEESYQDQSLASAQEASCGFILNSKGYRVSWKQSLPIVFQFSKNFPNQYKERFKIALNKWNQASSRNLFVLSDEIHSSTFAQADQKNVIYWVNEIGIFKSTEQAKTIARWVGTQLTDTDILINAHDWVFEESTATANHLDNQLDLVSLQMHELGHSLGITHRSLFKSVMYPYLQANTQRDVLLDHPDISDLDCEYRK